MSLSVIPAPAVLLPFTGISLADLFPRYGIWMYLLVFVIIMAASTIAGGPIPDNTFLLLTGAVAPANGLSVVWLLVMAAAGGFAGYEINYWSGRWFGLTVCPGGMPVVLRDGNVRNALSLMDRSAAGLDDPERFLPGHEPAVIHRGGGCDAVPEVHRLQSHQFGSLERGPAALGYYIGSTGIVSGYFDYLTNIFIVILAVAILVALFTLARDLLRRKDSGTAE